MAAERNIEAEFAYDGLEVVLRWCVPPQNVTRLKNDKEMG
jgi:hypothetical protein